MRPRQTHGRHNSIGAWNCSRRQSDTIGQNQGCKLGVSNTKNQKQNKNKTKTKQKQHMSYWPVNDPTNTSSSQNCARIGKSGFSRATVVVEPVGMAMGDQPQSRNQYKSLKVHNKDYVSESKKGLKI